jgi:iron(III) transport system permease protein
VDSPPLTVRRGRLAGLARPVAGDAIAALSLLPLVAAAHASLASDGGSLYRQIWGTWRGWSALGRSLELSALAASGAVVLGMLMASAAARLSRRQAMLLGAMCCLPLLVPSSLLATAWIVALGRQGAVTALLKALPGSWDWTIFSPAGAVLALALRYFGVAVLILTYARLRQRATWPAAHVFRPGRLAAVVHLNLRAALRPAALAWVIVLLLCINDHVIPDMVLVSTYGTQVLMRVAQFDMAGAAAVAAPVGAVGAALAVLAVLLSRPLWARGEDPLGDVEPTVAARRRWAWLAGAAVIVSLALAAPVGVMAGRAGALSAPLAALAEAQDQVWQTVRLAILAGVLCTALAAVVADSWLRSWRGGAVALGPLVLVNLAIPPSLIGIGVIDLANHWPMALVRDGSWPLVGAYVVRFLPVAALVLATAWREESPLPVLAARVHGLGRWRAAWSVQWPARRTALATTGLLCMILIATELELSLLLSPPGGSTLGVRLATLIHTANDAAVSALALGILGVVAPAIAVLILLVGRRKEAAA